MSILDVVCGVVAVLQMILLPSSGLSLEVITQNWHLHVQEVKKKEKVNGQSCMILSKIIWGAQGELWCIASATRSLLYNGRLCISVYLWHLLTMPY